MFSFKRLKDIREDNDLSQENMAKILGVKRSAYSLWELGINVIALEFLCKYADYFNVSIDYVLGVSNDKNNVLNKGLNLKVLGNNLKELRIKNNLSQTNLAEILNVSQACIVRYEKGLICISTSNLFLISKFFNISLNELCKKTKKALVLN